MARSNFARFTFRVVSFALLSYGSMQATAQNIGINANGAMPHVSALLDIDGSAIVGTKRGVLIPRVTSAERTAIVTPATSLLVFDTSLNGFWYYDGAAWVSLFTGPEVDPTWDGSALFTGATWRSGDVGLGLTAAPNSKLQVVGRVFVDNSTFVHAIAGNPALTVDGALNENILQVRDVGANNRLLVNSSGLVGISTSGPTARLSIGTIGSQLELGGAAASTVFKSNAGPLGVVAGNTLKLASIGFTSPLVPISLGIEALRTANGTTSTTTAIGLKFDVDATSPVNNAEIWLTNAGDVGIGTSTPTAKLDVNGKIRGTAIYGVGSTTTASTTTSTIFVYNAAITATITVQLDDIIKVDCACNISNSLVGGITQLRADDFAGTGTWIQLPNLIVTTGLLATGGYSTGLFQATANGNVTFRAFWRVLIGTGSVNNCNITALVIGKQ